MAVPANRLGSAVYTTAQLKTIQEIVTLLVFAGFSILYLKEPITWELRHRLCAGCGRRLLHLSQSAVSCSLAPQAVNLFTGCNNLMKARRLAFDISAFNGVKRVWRVERAINAWLLIPKQKQHLHSIVSVSGRAPARLPP